MVADHPLLSSAGTHNEAPREVDVMGSPFLSLEESKAEWAKTAVRAAGRYKESGKARRSFGKELAEHGFDIRVEAGRLEEMYEEMK